MSTYRAAAGHGAAKTLFTPEALAGQVQLPKAKRAAGPAVEQVLLDVLGPPSGADAHEPGQSLIRLAALIQLTGLYSVFGTTLTNSSSCTGSATLHSSWICQCLMHMYARCAMQGKLPPADTVHEAPYACPSRVAVVANMRFIHGGGG